MKLIRQWVLSGFAAVMAALAVPAMAAPEAIDPAVQVAQMGPAINILGYDDYWKTNGKSTFKPEYFAAIKAAGFGTVRVPLFTVDYLKGEHLDEAWLKKLDWVIEQSLKNNLTIILDVHDFETCAKDANGCATRLANVWYELSERYKNAPSSVVFELLNEPNGQVDDAIWNDWVVDLVAIVRETNPTRNLIIGPVMWNSLHELHTLKLPVEDRHIIATFHYYEPFRFTHQGAEWVPDFTNLKDVRFTATKEEVAAINADFDKALAWSKANNRPLLLGEFGAYGKYGKFEDRVLWISTVAKAADARGFARAYWYFDGGFGAYDTAKGKWIEPILKALVPNK